MKEIIKKLNEDSDYKFYQSDCENYCFDNGTDWVDNSDKHFTEAFTDHIRSKFNYPIWLEVYGSHDNMDERPYSAEYNDMNEYDRDAKKWSEANFYPESIAIIKVPDQFI